MDAKFAALIETLHPSFDALMSRPPISGGAIPSYGLPKGETAKGIYLFTEGGHHLYVGRSNRLLHRYKNHWMASKTEREAAFAFKLARKLRALRQPPIKRAKAVEKAWP